MKWTILNQPLGSACPAGSPTKKEIAWFVPLIASAVISAASTGAGAVASKKANDRARERLNGETAVAEAERRRRKYESWTDTASGQDTLRVLRDMADRESKRIRGAATVGGATEASVAAEKDLQNQKQAEVIAQATAAHEDKKDQVDAGYRQQIAGLKQQQINNDLQQGINTAQAASAVGNTFAQTAASAAMNMGAGSPGGGGVSTSQLSQMNDNYQKLQNSAMFAQLWRNGIIH